MSLQVTTIMLAVDDMDRSKQFYKELGASLGQDFPQFASFELAGGSALGIYPLAHAAADAGVPADGSGFRGVSFHHIVDGPEAVDKTIATAVAAGATIVRAAESAGWGGYFGYIADPDGHLWKIAAA
ncbi:VOC family protein [Nocardia stercoris]|uniref:Glyoxalase n=1 Tax=Nocardia stercoris TaxID=2483361 RepID=A0A3M2KTM5_9NOCA|nr:VOC family protein [Nocardia stercoris]RMI27810.1 glyoxalase [Nocardia stercoris]